VDIDDVALGPGRQSDHPGTGSQGERGPRRSACSRPASYRKLKLGPGDLVIISADPIPGQRAAVSIAW